MSKSGAGSRYLNVKVSKKVQCVARAETLGELSQVDEVSLVSLKRRLALDPDQVQYGAWRWESLVT